MNKFDSIRRRDFLAADLTIRAKYRRVDKAAMFCLVVFHVFICGCVSDVFKTSQGTSLDTSLNQMWEVYGRITDDAVSRWGNEATYFEMMALKLMWSDLDADKKNLRGKIIEYPCSDNGYLWSWQTEEGWPTHHARHYDTNAKYIIAAWRYYVWTGDREFLFARDNTVSKSEIANQIDVSKGLTLIDKLRKAMRFQLEELNGESGLTIITDPHSDGTVHGKPGDYWDNYLTGYKSAYINVYFYQSLLAMSSLEKVLNNNEGYDYYRNLAKKVKVEFNRTFWDQDKGRYVGCIDKEGRIWDFGFTFLNTEAVFYGLADNAKVERIYSWLDGSRIISEDIQTVNGKVTGATGKDIYSLGWAPRSNTRAVESVSVNGKYWWWDINGAITVAGEKSSASWGEHLENGGAIFYTSFYDIMSRLNYNDAENGWNRFKTIIEEFKKDQLRRDPPNNAGAPWKWGIIGEFPESGLVPTVFVYGFMGIDALADSLQIAPKLPKELNWAKVSPVVYRQRPYSIRAGRNADGFLLELQIEAPKCAQNHSFTIANLSPNTEYVLQIDRDRTKIRSDAGGIIQLKDVSAQNITLNRQP
jgi:hypothetical protein